MVKRALITGSSGYIGINLIKYLTERGFRIGKLDKKEGNYCEELALPKKHDLFGIVHLAGLSGIKQCQDRADQAVKDNIIAATNIFQQGLEHNIPVIAISSQAAKNPSSSIYAFTKFFIELSAFWYNSLGANIKVLRLSNVYGGLEYLERKNSVVAKFIRAKKNNEPLCIDGDGTQSRCFLHVNDAVSAIICLMKNCYNFSGHVFNIGNTEEISILDLAKKIIELTSSKSNIKFVPYNEAFTSGFEDMVRRVPDINKIRSYTAWTPQLQCTSTILESIIGC